ncbi:MAG: hypothetical protein MZW92_16845 [Comamonadaceae bacterium]|nr:hypothetical protein [Comamonadaceae bacterium]
MGARDGPGLLRFPGRLPGRGGPLGGRRSGAPEVRGIFDRTLTPAVDVDRDPGRLRRERRRARRIQEGPYHHPDRHGPEHPGREEGRGERTRRAASSSARRPGPAASAGPWTFRRPARPREGERGPQGRGARQSPSRSGKR